MTPARPSASGQRAAAALASGASWRWWEFALWAAAAASWAFLPSYHLLINEIAIIGLFVLSLDLILGYAGIVSLGHAAYFGLGAYLAGLLTKWGVTDPLLGLALVAPASAALGLATSFLVLRGSDLTRIMVTLSVSLVLFEIANRLTWLTGGADGMQGIAPGPLLGVWEFDIFGRVGCAYSLIALFVLFLIARRIVHSPFGLSVRAVQGNPLRAAAIGLKVNLRIVAFYTLGATYAGLAGALLVQTTQFASLDVLAFHRSAEVMLMLVIGGVGYLYGGILGAIGFKVMQDLLSVQTPQYWQFWVGIVLIALVVIGRDRIGALPRRLFARLR
jgi:branched-chain amino acid transport system permease protein